MRSLECLIAAAAVVAVAAGIGTYLHGETCLPSEIVLASLAGGES